MNVMLMMILTRILQVNGWVIPPVLWVLEGVLLVAAFFKWLLHVSIDYDFIPEEDDTKCE